MWDEEQFYKRKEKLHYEKNSIKVEWKFCSGFKYNVFI